MTPERWNRIKEIFQAATEHPAEKRDAYVLQATAGDAELRDEIDRMLRCATGTGLLDRPAWDGLRLEAELPAGTLLGPYEILQKVGAGGMGRVYKARDTRLGRTVAVKVLSAEFSHRLRVEGRAISALNHPHVCALYDIGDGDGYLVMEYVEGESLADCLARGPLPLDAVLRYGAEIADALAAAHAQGIVHRDLKPANIMITAAGVKVLDFGVARLTHEEETAAEGLAGTAAYMSPSQLNGNPADTRSDIFALGLVLYEMAAGGRYSDRAPDSLDRLPEGLAELVRQCLRPYAATRIQSMEEVRRALEHLRSQPQTPAYRPRKAPRVAASIALFAAAGTLAWILQFRRPARTPPPGAGNTTAITSRANAVRKPPPPRDPVQPSPAAAAPEPQPQQKPRPASLLPASLVKLASYPGLERDPSLSPDGSQIAFSWHSVLHTGYGIFVRGVNSRKDPTELTKGPEDWGPAWSPDGRAIAFRRKGQQSGIYRVNASGGPAEIIAPIAHLGQETLPEISWHPGGKWIAAPDRAPNGATRIYLFATASGEKRELTTNPRGTDHAPAFSPDGKSLAYTSCRGAIYPCDVYVIDFGRNFAVRRQQKITDEGWYIRGIAWLPDSKGLVFSAASKVTSSTWLWRISINPPGLPERIDIAGSQAHHPNIARSGGLLAFTNMGDWHLMLIRNFH